VKFSKDYVLFCHITTQIQGEKHGDLLEEKGGQGFPHIVFMDAEGNVLAVHEQDRTAAAFAKTGEKAKAFVVLKEKADKGDKSAKVELILVQLELGKLKPADAEKQLKEAGELTKEQRARFDAEIVNTMVMEIADAVDSEESAKAAGKKFYDLQKAGKPAPTSEKAVQPYFILGMMAAKDAKDAAHFEKNLNILKAKFGENPQAKRFFAQKDKELAELKEAKEEKKDEKKEEKK